MMYMLHRVSLNFIDQWELTKKLPKALFTCMQLCKYTDILYVSLFNCDYMYLKIQKYTILKNLHLETIKKKKSMAKTPIYTVMRFYKLLWTLMALVKTLWMQ